VLHAHPVDIEVMRQCDSEYKPHITWLYGKMRLTSTRKNRTEMCEATSVMDFYDYFRRVWNVS